MFTWQKSILMMNRLTNILQWAWRATEGEAPPSKPRLERGVKADGSGGVLSLIATTLDPTYPNTYKTNTIRSPQVPPIRSP